MSHSLANYTEYITNILRAVSQSGSHFNTFPQHHTLPIYAFSLPQLGGTLPESGAPPLTGRGCLNSDLHRLHGAERNIGKKLGTGRSSQVKGRPVQIALLLKKQQKTRPIAKDNTSNLLNQLHLVLLSELDTAEMTQVPTCPDIEAWTWKISKETYPQGSKMKPRRI